METVPARVRVVHRQCAAGSHPCPPCGMLGGARKATFIILKIVQITGFCYRTYTLFWFPRFQVYAERAPKDAGRASETFVAPGSALPALPEGLTEVPPISPGACVWIPSLASCTCMHSEQPSSLGPLSSILRADPHSSQAGMEFSEEKLRLTLATSLARDGAPQCLDSRQVEKRGKCPMDLVFPARTGTAEKGRTILGLSKASLLVGRNELVRPKKNRAGSAQTVPARPPADPIR
jgi:hypothetical protein